MTDLGTHPDYPASEGHATVINDMGTIAGHGYVSDEDGSYPMLWDSIGENWLPVATPPDFPYAEFYDINESNQLVGGLWNADQVEHAFVYDEQNGMRDLNDLIPLDSGWVLTYAGGINEKGRIAGFGTFNGEERAFLLLPILSGDFDKDNDVDGADLARFISEFGSLNCSDQSPCEADLNGDHEVNAADLKLFAANFGES
jgi:probable HAF family extracellular repeat protein